MSAAQPTPHGALEKARKWLLAADSITVLTGAGISTDSGIPAFRGPSGVWTKNPEAAKLVTLDAYLSDPAVRRRAWLSMPSRDFRFAAARRTGISPRRRS